MVTEPNDLARSVKGERRTDLVGAGYKRILKLCQTLLQVRFFYVCHFANEEKICIIYEEVLWINING